MNAFSKIANTNKVASYTEAEVVEQLAALQEEEVAFIDFDKLRHLLSETIFNSEFDNLKEQFDCLYHDYVARIAGMAKAIATVDRNSQAVAHALDYIESLQNLTAEELIKEYTKLSARFRNVFPASFGRMASQLRDRKSGLFTN